MIVRANSGAVIWFPEIKHLTHWSTSHEDTFIIISVIKNIKMIVIYQLLSDKSTVGELYYEMRPEESDQSRKILNKCFTIMLSFKKCNKHDCGKFICKATIEMLMCT